MRNAKWQYCVLGLLMAATVTHYGGYFRDMVQVTLHGAETPTDPFSLQMATRTIGNTDLRQDQVLLVNGKPFTAAGQISKLVAASRPGDKLHLVLSEPSGRAIERDVTIRAEGPPKSVSDAGLFLCVYVLIPIVCITLGFGVALIRPRDLRAWLLLFLLLGFSGIFGNPSWHRTLPGLSLFWQAFSNTLWAPAMMLFAIYFPVRLDLDVRRPWLKLFLLVPTILADSVFSGIIVIWNWNVDAALPWRPLFMKLYFGRLILQMITIGTFFAIMGMRSATVKNADERRRLRILLRGTQISLAPMFVVVLYSLAKNSDFMVGVPWPLAVFSLSMLVLFPLTLAYVIVVDRAMDLSFVVRQSIRYGVASGGLWVIRMGALSFLVSRIVSGIAMSSPQGMLTASLAVSAIVFIRRRRFSYAQKWLDKKFFREAYDADQILTDLAAEVGQYVETAPLVETVSRRIGETLHIPDISVLLRDGGRFLTCQSSRQGEPVSISCAGRIAAELGKARTPLDVFFDNPPDWIRTLDAAELQALDLMKSQLLIPIPGKQELAGIVSLGAKLSDAPYSATDKRLLQAVALQMGMALENSRLAASLAEAAAHREVMNRELEIAREVQERLFPQQFPRIAGVDCAGFCRPARGVGGDYYDFIELAGGRVGIAIGDVSGKGIAAALLMASLQASLRGQTLAGVHDLAGLMTNVNKLVYNASQTNRYATFFYAEFDPATGALSYVNAGHNPPVILRQDGSVSRLEASGPVVGLLPGVGFSMEGDTLHPGDIFIGYTDGISEAMNEQDEEWEEERFIGASKSASSLGAADIIQSVFRAADEFTGAAKQYDDMTLIVMKVIAR